MTYQLYGCLDAYNKIVGRLPKESSFTESLSHLKNEGNNYQVYMIHLNSPEDGDIMKQVIGREGCYFIRTTQECDLDFIWHDRTINKIEFWGPKKNLNRAMNLIQWRIDKITKSQLEAKSEPNSEEKEDYENNVAKTILKAQQAGDYATIDTASEEDQETV